MKELVAIVNPKDQTPVDTPQSLQQMLIDPPPSQTTQETILKVIEFEFNPF